MTFLEQSVEVGTVVKAIVVAASISGTFAVLKDDIGDLEAGKASIERVAVVETKQDEVAKATLRELQAINGRLAVIEGRLDGKADKP